MNNSADNFICKSKNLADYLIKHGSILISSYRKNGKCVFEFEYDNTIDENLELWETNKSRCLF